MAEGYSNKTNSSTTTERQMNHQRFGNHSNQPSNSSYMMRRGSRNRTNSNGDNNRQQRQVCRFFRRGACQYGERCRFAHTESLSMNNQNETASTSSTTSSASPNKRDSSSTSSSPNSIYDKWLDAPEFVPSASKAKIKSYAEVVNPPASEDDTEKPETKLCPYAEMHGVCSYPEGECLYLHGDICDLCGNAALHPHDTDKRKEHTQSCIKQHERNMELSFAVARSKDKSCGVCFEVVMEKASREQRFGILPNCNHVFCLSCIRKWRQAKQFDNKIIRACPECRVTSDFVCPSMFWVDTKEEKEKLIKDYKVALSQKHCKYFKQGRGKCPFGNKCFYLHALPDGTKTDVGPPPRQPRRQNHDGDIDMLQPGYSTEAGREAMIWSVLRRFEQYQRPPSQIQFRYGDDYARIQRRLLPHDQLLIDDLNDNTIENYSTNSDIDFDNGFVFSFVRSSNVLSAIQERRTTYELNPNGTPARRSFSENFYSESDIVTEDPSDSDSDDGYDDNYDSDGMGEPISRLLDPIDDQFLFEPAERSIMRARYYEENDTGPDATTRDSRSDQLETDTDIFNRSSSKKCTNFCDDDPFWNQHSLDRLQFMMKHFFDANFQASQAPAPTVLNKTIEIDFAAIHLQSNDNFSDNASTLSTDRCSFEKYQTARTYDANSSASSWQSENWQIDNWQRENWETENTERQHTQSENWQRENWVSENWDRQHTQSENWQRENWETENWQSDNIQNENWQCENWQGDNWISEDLQSENGQSENGQSENWQCENWQCENWQSENWQSEINTSNSYPVSGGQFYDNTNSSPRSVVEYNIREIRDTTNIRTSSANRQAANGMSIESDSDNDNNVYASIDEDFCLNRRHNYFSEVSAENDLESDEPFKLCYNTNKSKVQVLSSKSEESPYIVTFPDDIVTDSDDDFCLAQLFNQEESTDGPTIEEISDGNDDAMDEVDDFFKDEEDIHAGPIVASPDEGFNFSPIHYSNRFRVRYVVRIISPQKAGQH